MSTAGRADTASGPAAAAAAILDWYIASGIDTAEDDTPGGLAAWPSARRHVPSPQPSAPRAAPLAMPAPETSPAAGEGQASDLVIACQRAAAAAAAAETIEALIAAILAFDDCPLKASARTTVTHDGVLGAPLLIIGEAPGREEDEQGKPFVGRAGQLLDRMLAAIGWARRPREGLQSACITNAIYWRPPANRTPTTAELAVCDPFVRRFISLSRPRAVVLLGNVPTQSLVPGTPGITKIRGTALRLTLDDGSQVPAFPLFHPAFLLRQPLQKRLAYADLRLVAKSLL